MASGPGPGAGCGEPLYVRLCDAPKLCGLSRSTLERSIAAGKLPAFRIARRTLVRPEDLRALIEGPGVGADGAEGERSGAEGTGGGSS